MDTIIPAIVPVRQLEPDNDKLGRQVAHLAFLAELKVPLAAAFIVTPTAFLEFLHESNAYQKVLYFLNTSDPYDPISLATTRKNIEKLILTGTISKKLAHAIRTAYEHEAGENWVQLKPALGEAVVNRAIKGDADLIDSIRNSWANAYTEKVLFEYLTNGKRQLPVPPSLIISRYPDPKKTVLIHTNAPANKNHVLIEAVWGAGFRINRQHLIPDRYIVEKSTLTILSRQTSIQTRSIGLDRYGHWKELTIDKRETDAPKLTDEDIRSISTIALKIHRFSLKPQTIIGWLDGANFWVIESKESEEHSILSTQPKTATHITHNLKQIGQGIPGSPGIVSGPAKIITVFNPGVSVNAGEIAIITEASVKMLPLLRRASGIVSLSGGITSHVSIIAREVGIPAVVGVGRLTKDIKNGHIITVDGTSGSVFLGGVSSNTPVLQFAPPSSTADVATLPLKTATKVLLAVSQPDISGDVTAADGIGLIRGELLLAHFGYHPKRIRQEKRQPLFISAVRSSISKLSAAMGDRPVVYRLSDFESHEYRELKGGEQFEPKEINPMLGYHGALRLVSDEDLENELVALSLSRHKDNSRHLSILIPYVRTAKELTDVKRLLSTHKLHRSPAHKLLVSIETPLNLSQIPEFANVGIDGLYFNLDRLISLFHGFDLGNSEVNQTFEPLVPAFLKQIESAIKTAGKHQLPVTVYGEIIKQRLTSIEEFVKWGIEAVVIDPPMVNLVRNQLLEAEQKIVGRQMHG